MESEERQPQEQALPDPHSDPDPTPPDPELMESVQVPCGGCGRGYTFDIKPNTATFTFQCRGCGTRNEWARVQ